MNDTSHAAERPDASSPEGAATPPADDAQPHAGEGVVAPVAAAPEAEAAPLAQAPPVSAEPPASAAESAAETRAEPVAETRVEPAAEAPTEAHAPEIVPPEAHAPEIAPTEGHGPEIAPTPPAENVVAPDAGAPPAAPKPQRPPLTPEQQAANDERRKRAQEAWERVVAAHASGETLTGTVTAAVKGGLLVDVAGIRGFLPASQVRVPAGTAIDTLVKSNVPLKVIDVDNGRRRIVVSHRRAEQDERRAKRADLLKSLQVGQVREGTVVRLADFGAFVDLGWIDGLIPMRELAFERVEKSSDVVKVGETLPVEVLRIEENGKKISLSRKNALPDPWRDHAALLRTGTTVPGKVVDKERGLQVEIAPGVIGSVRESDVNPDDYAIGEEVEVSIRFVDRAKRRIGLTTLHGAAAVPPPTSSGFAPLGIELTARQSQRGKRR